MKKIELSEEEKRARRRGVRTNVIYALVFLSFTSLIFRASYVQIVEGKTYRQSELTTRFTKIPVLPQRGWIYDANGQVLALDKPTMSIVLNRYTVLSDEQYQQIAKTLAPVLETTANKLYQEMLKGDSGSLQVPLANDVTDAQVAFVAEHQSLLPNVQVVQDYTRSYPNGDLAGHVLGYVGAITAENEAQYKGYLYSQQVGETGIEAEYEKLLQGKPGYDMVTLDSSGKTAGSVGSVPPVDGDNIQLTLDGHEQAEAQMIMQNMIDNVSGKNKIEDASAVMLNAKTGGVIAMVSYPYMDPNWVTNGTLGQHLNYWNQQGVQTNNAITDANYPGSTIKPANLLTALKAGVVTPNTIFQDDGYIYIGTLAKHDDDGEALGSINPIQAIAQSSDVFFYEVGLWLGKWFGSSPTSPGGYPSSDGSMQHYLDTDFVKGINALFQGEVDFGLGTKTGIDLPGEGVGRFYIEDARENYSQVPYDLKASEQSVKKTGQYVNYSSPASLADAGFGQSQMFTPMELAQYVMTLADNGKKLKPHLLASVFDSNSTPSAGAKPLKTVKTTVQSTVQGSATDWDVIKEGMHDVTTDGTAALDFEGAPYQAAGKTGTAQIDVDGQPTDNSVFICYAPLNNPQVAVAVMAPGGGYGADFSAKIARQMIDAYFDEHHESFMPKKDWTSTAIPANWKSSLAYLMPEQSK